MFLFSDVANDYSDNMSEQVDMVEVNSEPNESDEMFSVCKNTNMVDNYSRNDKTAYESMKYISIIFYLILKKLLFMIY